MGLSLEALILDSKQKNSSLNWRELDRETILFIQYFLEYKVGFLVESTVTSCTNII